MSNLPAKQSENTIAALFQNPALKKQLQTAIPKHMSVDRLLRVAMTALRINPKLMECTQQSLLAAIMGCAQLGLEPEPFLGQAYLVPFKKNSKDANGKWSSITECQLIPGYRGYIALARRSGELQSLSAQVVYENDSFDLQFGLDEKLDHVPAEGDRGEVKGAYVVFRYKDGSHSFDYMSKEDIDKIRERSKSKDNGPWVTDYPEMAKKTVIRRHVKVAPLSVELAKAAITEEIAIMGGNQAELFLPESIKKEVEDQEPFDSKMPNEPLLDEFLSETSKANDMSLDELKAAASKDIEGFKKAFDAWKSKNQNKSVPAPDRECPSKDGATVSEFECSECKSREGCPAW